jgi:hypothetical protein
VSENLVKFDSKEKNLQVLDSFNPGKSDIKYWLAVKSAVYFDKV